MKTCKKCGVEQEHSCFYKSKHTKDGFRGECKGCRKAYDKIRYDNLDREKVNSQVRLRYLKNKDQILEKNRKKYAENLDKERARSKSYREKNSNLLREKSKEYYAKNKEKERARLEKWKAENPELTKMGRKKRRIQQYGAEHVFYTEKEVLDRYGTSCHICKEKIDFSAPRRNNKEGWEKGLHIDHVVPLARGGADSIENVKPSHGVCNLSKGKRYFLEVNL